MSEIELAGSALSTQTAALIDTFNYVLVEMDDFQNTLAKSGDWEALAAGVVQLIEFKKNLSILIDTINHNISEILPEKKVALEGIGVIERRVPTNRKWESETLLDHIVRECLDNGTGEITPADVMNLVDVLKKVLPITASLGWRTGALKEIGFDPDSYSDVSFGRKTVSIKK